MTAKDRAKDLGEKVAEQQHRSPQSIDMDVVGLNHWDTGNQRGVDSKTAVQHCDTGALLSTKRGTGGLSGTGAQISLHNRNVIEIKDSVISGKGAQLSLCNDNGIGAQFGSESGSGVHLYSKDGTPGQICGSVSTVVAQDEECKDSEVDILDNVDTRTELNPTKELNDLLCPSTYQPQKSISGVLNEPKEFSNQTQPKESNSCSSSWTKQSTSSPPSRPKEPFCRVLSRDGSRVLLWPSEMVSYTKTSPSISYSVNPLLHDFRAHSRAKEGGEEKRGGLEEGRERIKPSVIKQPGCQQRQEDMEGGKEVKIDEREEEDEAGQAGNPVELVAHCCGGNAALDRSSRRDESTFKFVPVSAECHLAPTLGLQNTGRRRRRRRKRRGGVRRGMRKRGRRKRGEDTDRQDSERRRRITSSLSMNLTCEGRGEERLKSEGTEREDRREKELSSNLAVHRLVGGKEKRMRGEERRIRGDQTEGERVGRNEEKRGELLSNLPVNRCNRCNQLCLQVKSEARQHQSQQSASGWGHGLRKLLCRGAACNSVISSVPGSVIETPCCPAITPDPAQNDREMGEMHKNTQAGKEEGQRDEEQRNLRKSEIRAVQCAEENLCNLAISSFSFPCQDAACEPEMCLVPTPYRETACDPTISLVPAPFRETACSQRQTISAGHSVAVSGLAPHCSAQQTETEPRIRSACADTTLHGDANSNEVMLKRAVTATKRTGGSLEPEAASRKKRKRGRRQVRRVIGGLIQEGGCVGLTSDLGVDEAICMQDFNSNERRTLSDRCNTVECSPEDKNFDFHCLCHNTNNREETSSCNYSNKLNNCCCCDSKGSAVTLSERDTCIAPSDHCHCDEGHKSDDKQDDSGVCGGKEDKDNLSCNCEDANVKSDKHEGCSHDYVNDHHSTNENDKLTCNTIVCSTYHTRADYCQYINKHTENKTVYTDCDSSSNKTITAQSNSCNITRNNKDCRSNDTSNHKCDYNHTNNKSGDSEEDKLKLHKINLSDSEIDYKPCSGTDQNDGNCSDIIDSGQCNYFNTNHVTDCNHCGDAVGKNRARNELEAAMSIHVEQREEGRVVEEEEEKQMERKRLKEKQEEWEKEWIRTKEKEKEEKERERRKEIDFEHLYPEKRSRYPHHIPPPCIPLHAPLLLPASLSSSSAFSFHHTIIQHHLSLLPPPSHLPVPSYPHFLPSFTPHLSPLTLNPPPVPPPPPPPPPPPLPPSFYTSPHIPLLDAPGLYPLATAFHPMQSHHPSLFPPTHPAVLPLQVLF